MRSIEWQHFRWPWVTFEDKMSLSVIVTAKKLQSIDQSINQSINSFVCLFQTSRPIKTQFKMSLRWILFIRDSDLWPMNLGGINCSKQTKQFLSFSGCKKLSCRREAARCFVSLNILLSHSRSLEVSENGTIRIRVPIGVPYNYDSILYLFRYKARYVLKIATFRALCIRVPVGILP